MILIVIVGLIALAVGLASGFRISISRNVNYKERWLEATELIKQLQTSPLSNEVMKSLEKPKDSSSKEKWKVQVEYCTRGFVECADFSATNGKQKVPLRSTYNWTAWPATFKSDQKKSERDVAQMNAAG